MTIIDELAHICELEAHESFILTGLFIADRDLPEINELLGPDRPNVGALGRYKGVPVFSMNAKMQDGRETHTYKRLAYSFVQMGALDIGDPVD